MAQNSTPNTGPTDEAWQARNLPRLALMASHVKRERTHRERYALAVVAGDREAAREAYYMAGQARKATRRVVIA